MSFAFSETSKRRLATCDQRLQAVFNAVILYRDCSIICGHRTREEQEAVLAAGKSKAGWLESPHNYEPSYAVDVMAFPIDWHDDVRNAHFAGFVLGVAQSHGINLVSGIDWDRDGQVSDTRFFDYPHYEISEWRQQAG